MLSTPKNFLFLFLFIFNNLTANEFSDDQDLKEFNQAIENNPYNFIDSNAQQMVLVLTKDAELFESDREAYENKIKDIFEPMIDFRRVAASVMGRKYYLLATKEQRAEFVEIFKDSLLDTYAETLAQWGDAEIITDFSYDEKKNKIVSVKQELLTTNNVYPIIYKLREYKNGTYKIVNIIINGINLGQTFHNQFQALAIEKNENISSIISEWKSDAFIDG